MCMCCDFFLTGTTRIGRRRAAAGEPIPLITMGETESLSLVGAARAAFLVPWPTMERPGSVDRAAVVDPGLPVGGVAFSRGGSQCIKCTVMNALTSCDLRPQCFLTGKYSSKEMTGRGGVRVPSCNPPGFSFRPAWATKQDPVLKKQNQRLLL